MFLRFIVFLILAYLLYRLIKTLFFSSSKTPLPPGEDMVLDPQCQSYVPKGAAVVRDGRYFCSESCARAFLAR
ncbi:MAG TPA: hypothetical protein VNL14_22015 [Candidatus Acidoferrales bacterium]|nr:hypothetical protein [Candidatus Acidoferrales bacterium]